MPEEKTKNTPEAEEIIANSGKVVIKVDDLRQAESQYHALDEMIRLTEDIAALGCTRELAFLVKDLRGQSMEERDFFKMAILLPRAAEKMKTIIENFAQYPRAARLYINCEETTLCHAVYELAKSSPRYLETAFLYLSVIDEDHDVYNTECLLPMLLEVYKGTEHEQKVFNGIRRVSNGWWAEGLGLEE